jgi:hypothetical protein
LVAQPAQHPVQPLPDVGEVDCLAGLAAEFAAERGDAVAQLAVVDAQAADPVAQPRLGAGNVGQQAVGPGGVVGFLAGRLGQDGEGAADFGEPSLLAVRRGGPAFGAVPYAFSRSVSQKSFPTNSKGSFASLATE